MIGICVMIAGSSTPPFYYGFMCEANWSKGQFYLGSTYFLCAVAGTLTLYNRKRRDRKAQNVTAYVSTGFAIAPGLYQMGGLTEALTMQAFPLWPWLVGCVLYISGGALFALYAPERLFPESRFVQTWCHSHTIFHVFVVLAALIQFWASLRAFHER